MSILFWSVFLEAVECIFKDPQYSFQCLRTMGYSSTGGVDIAECLSTAYRIKEEGAEEHCQMGAIMISNERILNWLENALLK